MSDGERLTTGKGCSGGGKESSSASSKSSFASAPHVSKTPQRAENKSRSMNSSTSASHGSRNPQNTGNTPQSMNSSSSVASSASTQRYQNSSGLRGSRSASRSRSQPKKRTMKKRKQNENKPSTNCPDNPRVKCVLFRPISKPRLIPDRVSAPPTLPQTANSPLLSQLPTDNDEIYIRDVPDPVTLNGARSDPIHLAIATCASASDPILANIKGPLTVRTRRRMGRFPQNGDIFVEETIDILGANDPSATVEQVKGRPIQQGARDLKVNNENDKNNPSVDGGAVIATGIAQLHFVIQLPSQGPLDFTWDQQFTTAQDSQPIPVDFTQRPSEAHSIKAMIKSDFTGPVNIALHLNSTRTGETPITTITKTTAQSSQPKAAPPFNSNVSSSVNTLIRNAIEIRFGESKALPTTELRKKVPSLTRNLGHPQIRERVFFGDGVIRLDRDMLIRPEDGVGEMKEDVRTYDFIPATLPALGERRFSMAPYSELFGFSSLMNIPGERARARTPIVNAQVSIESTKRSSSISSLATAIPYQADSSMNRTSMCSTASSPSVQTARFHENSFPATSGRSSRSKLKTAPPHQQKVSARTGVSMNRLERTQTTPPPSVLRQECAKKSTEVSSLESTATVTAQSPSSRLSGSASIATDRTQRSVMAPCKTSPHGQRPTPMFGRYTPATHSNPRTINFTLAPSSTGTTRTIAQKTPQFREQSQATQIRSQTIAMPHYDLSYTTNQRQASARRPHHGVAQSGHRSGHGYKFRSGKSSKTSRASKHPTALDIISGEGMTKRGNTPVKLSTNDSATHSTSANRKAKSIEATTIIKEPVNRLAKPDYRLESHRQCRGCGKSLTQKKKSTASAAQNPSVQILETNGGRVCLKIKMSLDISELLKQKKMSSSATSASSRLN